MSKRAKWSVIDMSKGDEVVSEHETREEAQKAAIARGGIDRGYIAACPWDGIRHDIGPIRPWTEVDHCS